MSIPSIPVRRPFAVAATLALLPLLWPVHTLAQPVDDPGQLVQLSASAQREVVQDSLTAVLQARLQGADATSVQNQLKTTLEQALQVARAAAAKDRIEVSTGLFSIQPRYGREGQISGWQGSAELRLQGQDVAAVSALAGRLPGMSVSQMSFSLSRAASEQVEAAVRQEAIERFRTTAQSVARGFGFNGYELRQVSIDASGGPEPRPLLRAMADGAVAAASAMPVPVEPGKGLVQVTVSGQVRLR